MDEHVIDNPQVYNIIYYNISIIGVSWIHVNNHHIYLWIGFPILSQPSNLSTPLYLFICMGDFSDLYTPTSNFDVNSFIVFFILFLIQNKQPRMKGQMAGTARLCRPNPPFFIQVPSRSPDGGGNGGRDAMLGV